jgi:hypothetical protein
MTLVSRFLPPRRRALAAAAAALAALAGCTPPEGGTLVHSPLIKPLYSPDQVGAFGPGLPVQVVGRPPDGSDAEAVVAAMRLPARFRTTRVVPVETPGEGQRIVVVFAPSGRLGWCRDPQASGGAGPADGFRAGLAYCWGGREMTSVVMETRAARGPSGSGFRAAMIEGLHALLPARDPKIDGPERSPALAASP